MHTSCKDRLGGVVMDAPPPNELGVVGALEWSSGTSKSPLVGLGDGQYGTETKTNARVIPVQ